jgi:hypothetical protein
MHHFAALPGAAREINYNFIVHKLTSSGLNKAENCIEISGDNQT